jgi:hypothetical protein
MTARHDSPLARMLAQGEDDAQPSALAPSAELPAPVAEGLPGAPSVQPRELREPIGTRIRQRHKRALDRFVYELKSEGWNVSQHHVLEALLSKLDDPAFASSLRRELIEGG